MLRKTDTKISPCQYTVLNPVGGLKKVLNPVEHDKKHCDLEKSLKKLTLSKPLETPDENNLGIDGNLDDLEKSLKKLSLFKPVETPEEKRLRNRRMNADLRKLRRYEDLAMKRRTGTLELTLEYRIPKKSESEERKSREESKNQEKSGKDS